MEKITSQTQPARILTEAVQRLSLMPSLQTITQIVAEAARALANADGTTFVLRDGENCYYVDENAVSPLWKGRRFPIEMCVSGWCMRHREVLVIEDVYKDARIPHTVYRATFVASLCMVPIRQEDPLGAIGSYWSSGYVPTEEQIKYLQILANSASVALENHELRQDLKKNLQRMTSAESRGKEMEAALHALAHDFRNPLSTIQLTAELLQSKLQENKDVKIQNYLETILRTALQANEQIQRMLSIYSIANQKVSKERVNLSAIVNDIANSLKDRDPKRDVAFVVAWDQWADVDPHLIRIALDNLISNAFKYTSKKPKAELEFGCYRSTPEESLFFIKDNGDGFDPKDAGRLFRPLTRLHSEKEFPGTGMGLASVARIIEAHGGKVSVVGQKNEGATFFFSIPRQMEAAI